MEVSVCDIVVGDIVPLNIDDQVHVSFLLLFFYTTILL